MSTNTGEESKETAVATHCAGRRQYRVHNATAKLCRGNNPTNTARCRNRCSQITRGEFISKTRGEHAHAPATAPMTTPHRNPSPSPSPSPPPVSSATVSSPSVPSVSVSPPSAPASPSSVSVLEVNVVAMIWNASLSPKRLISSTLSPTRTVYRLPASSLESGAQTVGGP